MTRVLIADDDPRITEIHQHYVNKVEGFEVIGLSNTLEDAEMQIRVMEPQLLLLDIYFPDGSGIDLLKHCLLYTSPSPRDQRGSRMPSSA